MTEIVIATGNPHKVEEMREIFGTLLAASAAKLRLLGLKELAEVRGKPFPEPAEVGSTFEENARIKARAYALETGRMCLADDSGLEIDALGGRPGVISSHYCTEGRETGMSRGERDGANNERVMRELEGTNAEKRTARFVCVMVLADAKGEIRGVSRGTFEGRIGMSGDVPRGGNGFGYDPLFLVAPGHTQTSAELDGTEKNRLSHRGAAAKGMAEILKSLAR